jgi:DNA polymerase-1
MEGRFECKPDKAEEFVRYITLLSEYRKLEKTRANYIEGLINKVGPDGKLRTTFKFGTETGRLSSEKPNFQNITREGPQGLPSLRSLFLPSPGNVLVSVDLSQAELRTIAKVANVKELIDIYRDSSRSLHKERAVQFYGKDYTKEQYVIAKNINFGVSYLQSAFTFAQMYNMPQEQAQAYIDDWFNQFPEIKTWHEQVFAQVKEEGTVVSPFGHKRRFHLLTKENEQEVYRQAVNFIPQNVAGVLTEHAIIELVAKGIPVVTSTHDSIVADVPIRDATEVATTMKRVMEQQAIEQLGWEWDDIPFVADVSIGPNWGAVEEVVLEEVAA